jgi:hypothetical protein
MMVSNEQQRDHYALWNTGGITMNTFFLYLAMPAIAAGTYGLTWLLWTAVGIGLPAPKGRVVVRRKSDSVERRASTPVVFPVGDRFAEYQTFAASPREERHGLGANLNN